MLTPAERLSQILKHYQININQFSTNIGKGRPDGLYKIESGNYGISSKMADSIIKAYPEISRAWLLTGEGDMIIDNRTINSTNTNSSPPVSKPIVSKNPTLEEVVHSNRLMAEAQLKQVDNMANLIKLLERRAAIEDEAKRSQQDTDSTLKAIQKVLIDVGVKAEFFLSQSDGQSKLGKIVSDELMKGELKSSPDGVGKPHK